MSSATSSQLTKRVTEQNKRGTVYTFFSLQTCHHFPRIFLPWIWGGTRSTYHKLGLNCLQWNSSPQSPPVPYFILDLNSRILRGLPGRSRHPIICTAHHRRTAWFHLWLFQHQEAVPKDHHLGALFKSPIPWPLPRLLEFELLGMGPNNVYIYKYISQLI